MRLTENTIRPGIRVRVAFDYGTGGMLIHQKYLDARRVGATGITGLYVPGHGGDIYWVKHDDGTIAAFGFMELEHETDPDDWVII